MTESGVGACTVAVSMVTAPSAGPARPPQVAAGSPVIVVVAACAGMNVISMTFRMLGENLKGSGQSGLAFLTYP